MISQLDRTLDSNLLHVELYSRPFKKSFLNQSFGAADDNSPATDAVVIDGDLDVTGEEQVGGVLKEKSKDFCGHYNHNNLLHHHTRNTFQIGNEDAGYQPSRAALRQFAQTQNDTSFHIGDDGCNGGEENHQIAIDETTTKTLASTKVSNRFCKTSKRCFPSNSTVHNPPFGIQRDLLLCESSNQQSQQNMDNQRKETVEDDQSLEIDLQEDKGDETLNDQDSINMVLNENDGEQNIDKENQRPSPVTKCDLVTKDPKVGLEVRSTFNDVNTVNPNKIGDRPSSSCNTFKIHRASTQNIMSAQKLGFAAPSGDYSDGIIRNKVQFKERLQEIKQSLKRNGSPRCEHQETVNQSPSTIDEYPLYPTQYPCPGPPLTHSDLDDDDAKNKIITKKPDPKELHRQVYYQSVVNAEKSMQEKLLQNDHINERGITILDSSVSPLPPKQLHKLTYESADRQQHQQQQQQRVVAEQWASVRNLAESRARRKHFHTQSRLVYGSESMEAYPPKQQLSSSPRFVIKRSEPIALSLGYRLHGIGNCDTYNNAGLSPPAFSSEVTPQNSSDMLLDGMLDQMSFEDDSMAVDVGSECGTEFDGKVW